MPLANPGIWNLTVYAGATFSERATPSGAWYDLTGYAVRASLRASYPDVAALLAMTDTPGAAYVSHGDAAGWVQIDMDDATTAALGAAVGHTQTQVVWDIELDDGTDVTRFAYGVVTIKPEATR